MTAFIATLAVSIAFMLLPAIDIDVSRAFYLPGVGFPVGQLPAFKALRTLGLFSMQISIWVVCGFTLLRCLVPAEWQPPIIYAVKPHLILYLGATLAVGPGLVANVVLKDHWGRARPIDTTLFGGEHAFSLPWVISDGCARNCSFVSGEGSGSFWFIALVFVVAARWRWTVARIAIAWTIIISLNRIAFGGHFLSDVLIGWGLMAIVILATREYILIRHGARLDAMVTNWIGRISDPDFATPAQSKPQQTVVVQTSPDPPVERSA